MTEKSKFLELTRSKYKDQAIWYLNGFWQEGAESEAENIWNNAHKFIELDARKKEGNELDEFWSHKFLESLGETLTVIQLREKLRTIDLDVNGKMALLEYLMFKYSKGITEVLNAPQGDNREEIEQAQQQLEAVQLALDAVSLKLKEQKEAKAEVERRLKEQTRITNELKVKKQEQQQKLQEQRAAEDELRSAVNDLKAQEDSFQQQIELLTRKGEEGSSIVAKNKAKQELAQLKQENPLPLRKAKITQEAALRKVEKQRKEVEGVTKQVEAVTREVESATREVEYATTQAEKATRELEGAQREAAESTRRVEEAVRQTEVQMQQAFDYLEEVKKKGGVAHGAIWWMERELQEAKKYLPRSKQ